MHGHLQPLEFLAKKLFTFIEAHNEEAYSDRLSFPFCKKTLQIPSAHNSLRSSSPPAQITSPPAARYLSLIRVVH
jgi:hypothetical protein